MLLLGCRLWSLVSTRDEKLCDQFCDQMAISRPKRRPRKSLTCGDAFSISGGGGNRRSLRSLLPNPAASFNNDERSPREVRPGGPLIVGGGGGI